VQYLTEILVIVSLVVLLLVGAAPVQARRGSEWHELRASDAVHTEGLGRSSARDPSNPDA
jgi:hypothetical protein